MVKARLVVVLGLVVTAPCVESCRRSQRRLSLPTPPGDPQTEQDYVQGYLNASELLPWLRLQVERDQELRTNWAILQAQQEGTQTVRAVAPPLQFTGDESVDLSKTYSVLLVAEDIPPDKTFLDIYDVRVGPDPELAVIKPAASARSLRETDIAYVEEKITRHQIDAGRLEGAQAEADAVNELLGKQIKEAVEYATSEIDKRRQIVEQTEADLKDLEDSYPQTLITVNRAEAAYDKANEEVGRLKRSLRNRKVLDLAGVALTRRHSLLSQRFDELQVSEAQQVVAEAENQLENKAEDEEATSAEREGAQERLQRAKPARKALKDAIKLVKEKKKAVDAAERDKDELGKQLDVKKREVAAAEEEKQARQEAYESEKKHVESLEGVVKKADGAVTKAERIVEERYAGENEDDGEAAESADEGDEHGNEEEGESATEERDSTDDVGDDGLDEDGETTNGTPDGGTEVTDAELRRQDEKLTVDQLKELLEDESLSEHRQAQLQAMRELKKAETSRASAKQQLDKAREEAKALKIRHEESNDEIQKLETSRDELVSKLEQAIERLATAEQELDAAEDDREKAAKNVTNLAEALGIDDEFTDQRNALAERRERLDNRRFALEEGAKFVPDQRSAAQLQDAVNNAERVKAETEAQLDEQVQRLRERNITGWRERRRIVKRRNDAKEALDELEERRSVLEKLQRRPALVEIARKSNEVLLNFWQRMRSLYLERVDAAEENYTYKMRTAVVVRFRPQLLKHLDKVQIEAIRKNVDQQATPAMEGPQGQPSGSPPGGAPTWANAGDDAENNLELNPEATETRAAWKRARTESTRTSAKSDGWSGLRRS